MSSFTREHFTGYTRTPGQTRVNVNRPTVDPLRRTSRVKYKTPSPPQSSPKTTPRKRRTSKEKSPRSQLLKRISKGFKRMSPRKFRNKHIRDIGELAIALSPFILAAIATGLYFRDKPKDQSDA